MHTIEHTEGDVLEVALAGRVTTDDYEAVIPALESNMESKGEVRLLCDVRELESVEPLAIWADVVFDMRHRTEPPRIAVVSDSRWQQWARDLFLARKPTSILVFDAGRYELARRWVREKHRGFAGLFLEPNPPSPTSAGERVANRCVGPEQNERQ